MSARHRLVVAATLLVAGCAAGPRPQPPIQARVAPPPKWLTDPGPAGDPTVDWWRALNDPVLDALVARAVANNGDVLVAAERVMEAQARVRLSRAGQLPTLDAEFTGIPRERTDSAVTGAGITVAGYDATLGVSYDADLFGRLRNQTAASRAQLLGSKAAAQAVRIATIASVASGYVKLRTLDAGLAIAQETLTARQRELAMVQHQARSGYVMQIAVSEASAEVHAVEQQVAQLQLQIRQEEDAITLLLGDPPGAVARGRGLTDLALLAPPSTVPARLLRRRPDIYEAEQAVVAADRTLDSARAAFMPDLQIAVTGERLATNVLPNPLWLYSFAGSVIAPLFEGGRLRATQDVAAAQRNQAALAYRQTALQAFGQVEDALAGNRQLAIVERAATAAAADDAASLQAGQHRFDQGYSSYQEVLDAERSLLAARLTAAEARGDRLVALVQLYQAMGGGWTAESPAR